MSPASIQSAALCRNKHLVVFVSIENLENINVIFTNDCDVRKNNNYDFHQ